MQEIKLDINKVDLYNEVAKTTAYIGGKNVDANGKNLLEQVFVTNADREMLQRSWAEAIDNVNTVLGNVLRQSTDEDKDWCIGLGMPNNFPKEMTQTLESTITHYAINKMVADWCAIVDKEEVENYVNQSTALLAQMSSIINKRRRPVRNF